MGKMEDRRVHERLDGLEKTLKQHLVEHSTFEASLAENTTLTKTIAENTSELVALVKGTKGFRNFLVWATPLLAFFVGLYAYIRGLK
jgi:hypothetical protein